MSLHSARWALGIRRLLGSASPAMARVPVPVAALSQSGTAVAARNLTSAALRQHAWRAAAPTAAGVRHLASQGRQEGTIKMWNEERGFGFIAPVSGGDDVFLHRSAIGEGVQLSSGMAVTYEAEWDDKKKKDRAADVQPLGGGGGGGGRHG
mmetsp:Transcript_48656/g.130540  ORF Transcript_48656/g.130540 Transcript_48656/m.130540 type:complete len:151 (-) Transcript_48656:969-1421(-)